MMKNEKGKAVLELAIVAPFFLVLFVGLIDIAFIIRKQQYLSVALREAGNAAYRQCQSAIEGEPTNTCLQNSTFETLGFINNNGGVVDGADVLVRSWEVTESDPVLKGEYRTGQEASRFNEVRVGNLNSYNKDLRESIITVEVFLDNTDSNIPFFSRNLYDAMVF